MDKRKLAASRDAIAEPGAVARSSVSANAGSMAPSSSPDRVEALGPQKLGSGLKGWASRIRNKIVKLQRQTSAAGSLDESDYAIKINTTGFRPDRG